MGKTNSFYSGHIKQPPGQAEGKEYAGKRGRKGNVETANK
jgi:hypothetical protein